MTATARPACFDPACRRPGRAALLGLALLGAPALGGAASWADTLAPSAVYAQAGAAVRAHTLVFGAVWDWSWLYHAERGAVTGYWELSFGRWASRGTPGGRSSAWVTQLGVTPVLRWYPAAPGTAGSGAFVEAGIGANLLAPLYRSHDKRFSTTFNFGDHLAVGWRLGPAQRQEVSLRVQHFSNAGIRHPNPGEDFVQLRYLLRY